MLKRYFVTGLLLWVPLVITVWVLNLIVGTMDQSLALLPAKWQPQVWLGRDIPGVGVVLTVLIVFVTGLLTTNFIGRALVQLGEWILSRIPVVRTLYSSVKQVSDTILSPHGQAFRKALLVEYPRRGCCAGLPDRGALGRDAGEDGRVVRAGRGYDGVRVRAHHAQSHVGLLPDDAS